MERVALGLAFVILVTAIFTLPSAIFGSRPTATVEPTSIESTNSPPAIVSSAPLTSMLPPQRAYLPDPPPLGVEKIPPARETQGKSAFERATPKERNLVERRCDKRPMKSITVLPDGSVHVDC